MPNIQVTLSFTQSYKKYMLWYVVKINDLTLIDQILVLTFLLPICVVSRKLFNIFYLSFLFCKIMCWIWNREGEAEVDK